MQNLPYADIMVVAQCVYVIPMLTPMNKEDQTSYIPYAAWLTIDETKIN